MAGAPFVKRLRRQSCSRSHRRLVERPRRVSAVPTTMGGSSTCSHSHSRHTQHTMLIPSVLGLRLLLLCFLLGFPELGRAASRLGKRDFSHLSADALSEIIAHPDPVRNIDPANPSSHLSKILIPRPPDTANNTLVREYIVSTLKDLKWHIEEDSFTDTTPYGVKRFTNIIATKDPAASRRVILAAHFDSKFFSKYPDSQVRTGSATLCLRFSHNNGSSLLAQQTLLRHVLSCST